MQSILDFLRTLYSAERLIALLSSLMMNWLGYAFMFGVVFAETGLLLGFFLPGDSFLFTVGVVAGAGGHNVLFIIVMLCCAAIIGDAVGYQLGRRAGPVVFNRPDSRWFKREHLLKTKAFYEKHGGKTIIYARFVPIIRTFAPFVAGVAEMPYSRFAAFNVFGGIGWVFSMVLLGYTLGNVDIVRRHFEKVVLGIIFVSVLPILFEAWKSRRSGASAPALAVRNGDSTVE
jgi:membrane-associated protein